jgi:hypothetical protein
VHAISHRITVRRATNPSIKQQVEENVDKLTEGGYTVLKPLYILLPDFEKSDMPFDQYLPIMLKKLPEYSP